MSLPTNFFIGRGSLPSLDLYTILLIGGGGGAANSNGTGGPGGVTMFTVEMPAGTYVQTRAGGYGSNNNQFGGGGGYSNVSIPSLGFSASVGGGGGSAYEDMGGWGGGAGRSGSCGIDYQGTNDATYTTDLQDTNQGSGDGGTPTSGGSGGINPGGGAGTAGSVGTGGVYSNFGHQYPGGGGGGGYYGGGSGCNNNGWGGGPGGGGSGELTIGTSRYTEILSTLNNHPVQTHDASTLPSLNYSMNFTIGTCRFLHPHNYNQGDYYLQNYQQTVVHQYDGIAVSGNSRFAGFAVAGGGARKVSNSTAQGGVVVIFKESETSPTLVRQGNLNNNSSSLSGDVTYQFYTT